MKANKAHVFVHGRKAGLLERCPDGYRFLYDPDYLSASGSLPVSLTLPLTDTPYESKTLFPFFLGLLPEGWFLEITCRTLKIDPDNSFDLLAATCRDCIGAVSIVPAGDEI